MQRAQQTNYIAIAIWLMMLAIIAWVVYMFYARLSDIAAELRKIRITYQGTVDREEDRLERLEAQRSHPTGNPSDPASGDNKYQPRP